MLPTRALFSRSVWKGTLPIKAVKPGDKKQIIKTQARSATILPNFVGVDFMVHNGRTYQHVSITEDMVGHKLGEFAATRKPFTYKMSKNK
ncbi:mitochondrial ribosomal protein S19 [Phyllosticta capitalensis]